MNKHKRTKARKSTYIQNTIAKTLLIREDRSHVPFTAACVCVSKAVRRFKRAPCVALGKGRSVASPVV